VSNFTYFLDDPRNGDQFGQVDVRWVGGVHAARRWSGAWGGRRLESAVGFELRGDEIANGLHRTRDAARISTVRSDDIRLLTGGPYAESTVHWNRWLRTRVGLRADAYLADVESSLAANSGSADDLLLSPKLAVALGPWKSTEVYLNVGHGFHSNDARGATIRVDPTTGEPVGPVPPLVRARGGDVGLRTTALPGLQTTLSLFALELDSELLFVGDGGATEAGRPSRRTGIEWANHFRANDWLTIDLDATWTDARFTDHDPAGDEIPGAVRRTVAAGVSIGEGRALVGALRLRHFGGAPLVEDGSVRSGSSTLVNAAVGWHLSRTIGWHLFRTVQLELEAFNLLDREDSDVEYFYASRLPDEPAEGVEDIHFHPVERRSFRLVATWRL
jgi:hypothetical protein